MLDRALVLWTQGPATATGEDVAELHLHGGRAVVAAALTALAALPGLRLAEPGEFTRRAFLHGRIDLGEAEGLSDLLAAETESQRRNALRHAGGAFGRMVAGWRQRLLQLSAHIEAAIEYGDEDETAVGSTALPLPEILALEREIGQALAAPPAERLRDGIRVVIAGSPNAGKSTLLNALVGRNAAIVSDVPGTTRDVIEAPVTIAGMPFLFSDTAGLRETSERIEQEGIRRARQVMVAADILLWLDDMPIVTAVEVIAVRAKADLSERDTDSSRIAVSAVTGLGLPELNARLIERARLLLPRADELALNARQRRALADGSRWLEGASQSRDELIVAEHVRAALAALDAAIGASGTEEMLDALFGSFCLGK